MQMKLPREKQSNDDGKAQNHAKFYVYDSKYYKNRPTILIGDFFRFIGNIYFSGFVGKNFLSGEDIRGNNERRQFIYVNILCAIANISFWILIIACFLITVPKQLFVLAIVSAASRFVVISYNAYFHRQLLRKDIYFCECQKKVKGEAGWHASFEQVTKRSKNIPDCKFISPENFEFCNAGK